MSERISIPCKFCRSSKTVKSGKRESKYGPKQIYQCRKCDKRFTVSTLPNYTYKAQAVIAAPILYYLGYSLTETRKRIIGRYKVTPSLATIGNWVNKYGKRAAIKKYRDDIKKKAKPHKVIQRVLLKHKQNYLFQVHEYKLNQLTSEFYPLREYLLGILKNEIKIDQKKFPFRASNFELGMSLEYSKLRLKSTYESKIAGIALKAARNNYQRHSILQKFFLATDKSTIAVEVPVFLDQMESKRILGKTGGLLGHIDFLQVLNGQITILDYKPEAFKEKNVLDQLLLYAIGFSVRTGIHLNKMHCAWFDENDFFKIKAIELYRIFSKTRIRTSKK